MWPGALAEGTLVVIHDPFAGRIVGSIVSAVLSWGLPFYLVERSDGRCRFLAAPALTHVIEGDNVALLRRPATA